MIKKLYLLSFLTFVFFSCSENSTEIVDQGKPDLRTSYDYVSSPTPTHSNLSSFFNLSTGKFEFIPINFGGGIMNNGVPFDNLNHNFVNITNEGAALGRVLFYDKKLSLNNTVACASCHHQDKAFADGKQFSPGFEGRVTERNSMGILNPRMQNNLFWDSRSQSIQDLSLKPIQNHIEMGMEDMSFLTEKLGKIDYYPELFQKAFGTNEITPDNISSAISQFLASITTSESKFDAEVRAITNNQNSVYNELERRGLEVFFSAKSKCSTCHAGANLSAPDGPFDPYGGGAINTGGDDPKGTANIGLDLIEKDKGKGKGQFKIPSLRNIALTGPYMHDGRFKTLEEVLEHYSNGIKANANLDPKFKDASGKVKGIDLNDLDKRALIAFLHTLTDDKFITDPKYSNPFKK